MTLRKCVIFYNVNCRLKAFPKGSAFFDGCWMVMYVINGNCQDTKALLSSEKSHEKENQEAGEKQTIYGDAAASIRYLLRLPPVESVAHELEDFGVPKHEQTNMIALQARLYGKAMGGDLKSYEVLMKMGGYEAPTSRSTEQDGKPASPEAKANEIEDVIIYLPEIEGQDRKSQQSEKTPDSGG